MSLFPKQLALLRRASGHRVLLQDGRQLHPSRRVQGVVVHLVTPDRGKTKEGGRKKRWRMDRVRKGRRKGMEGGTEGKEKGGRRERERWGIREIRRFGGGR